MKISQSFVAFSEYINFNFHPQKLSDFYLIHQILVVPTDLKNREDFIVKLLQSDFPKHENSPTVCA